MKYIGLMNISFHQIQSFLAVANYMNMTNAAESIHVTQPLLSQKVSSLEEEIGVTLFTRSKKKLLITPAGKYLYEHWSNILDKIEENVAIARTLQKRSEKSLTIGFCFGIPTQTIVNIVETLRNRFPDLTIDFQLIEIFQIRNCLLDHRIDVAIATNYDLDNNASQIKHTTIKDSNINVVVSKSHMLAKLDTISWLDLKDCNILCQPASQTGGYERCISNICQHHGFVPSFVMCNNIFSAITHMSLGDGILVGVLSPLYESLSNYIVFKMEDPTIPIVMSYYSNPNSTLEEFINSSKDILASFF